MGLQEQANPVKVYVQVEAVFREDGRLTPAALLWEDGRRYEIRKVTDVRKAVARRAGALALRFTVDIAGRESYLFFEPAENPVNAFLGRWFVERK